MSSVPLIIFAYMYQVNIPMIYHELESKNFKRMSSVVSKGTIVAIVLYTMVGIFGYLTFVYTPDVITQNILEEKPYQGNAAVSVVSIMR